MFEQISQSPNFALGGIGLFVGATSRLLTEFVAATRNKKSAARLAVLTQFANSGAIVASVAARVSSQASLVSPAALTSYLGSAGIFLADSNTSGQRVAENNSVEKITVETDQMKRHARLNALGCLLYLPSLILADNPLGAFSSGYLVGQAGVGSFIEFEQARRATLNKLSQ